MRYEYPIRYFCTDFRSSGVEDKLRPHILYRVHFTLHGTNVMLRCRVGKLCSHEGGATARGSLFSEWSLHIIVFIARSVFNRLFGIVFCTFTTS